MGLKDILESVKNAELEAQAARDAEMGFDEYGRIRCIDCSRYSKDGFCILQPHYAGGFYKPAMPVTPWRCTYLLGDL